MIRQGAGALDCGHVVGREYAGALHRCFAQSHQSHDNWLVALFVVLYGTQVCKSSMKHQTTCFAVHSYRNQACTLTRLELHGCMIMRCIFGHVWCWKGTGAALRPQAALPRASRLFWAWPLQRWRALEFRPQQVMPANSRAPWNWTHALVRQIAGWHIIIWEIAILLSEHGRLFDHSEQVGEWLPMNEWINSVALTPAGQLLNTWFKMSIMHICTRQPTCMHFL